MFDTVLFEWVGQHTPRRLFFVRPVPYRDMDASSMMHELLSYVTVMVVDPCELNVGSKKAENLLHHSYIFISRLTVEAIVQRSFHSYEKGKAVDSISRFDSGNPRNNFLEKN